MRELRARLALMIISIFVLSGGCASNPDDGLFPGSDSRPVERIYNSGLDYLLDRDYIYAIEEFNLVEEQYPYSVWVRHSLLMAGFTHYLINQYPEAIAQFDRFIALYPGNQDAAYAYYVRAMCFYEQIGEANRDQSTALAAYQAFGQVLGFFPNSIYARDAQVKIALVQASLAAKEMYLGRWAMEHDQFAGALNRFQSVVANYGQSGYVAEALHRTVEVYLTLGLDGEARRTASLLGHNFPDSLWYKSSYALLKGEGLVRIAKAEKKDAALK